MCGRQVIVVSHPAEDLLVKQISAGLGPYMDRLEPDGVEAGTLGYDTGAGQTGHYVADGRGVVGDGLKAIGGIIADPVSTGRLCLTDALDSAFCQDLLAGHFEQLVLEGSTADVGDQDFHMREGSDEVDGVAMADASARKGPAEPAEEVHSV